MKKSILNLTGAQELSKNEQKSVSGGRLRCNDGSNCPNGQCCSRNVCWPIGAPGHLCEVMEVFDPIF
ncbi:hypothetical protein ACFSX9_09005 [Flavobacterium ardleyense]|uniref:Bacteriocin-type signal sequence-containing protein n=1 Tax=Flavobacterium ardleyense TaxID=2038737 RepID=A0ABW5Z8N1_9FLAO